MGVRHEGRSPLWVIRVILTMCRPLPVYPEKQTIRSRLALRIRANSEHGAYGRGRLNGFVRSI